MKIVSVSEMREIEQAADRMGWSYTQMMEMAGKGIAEWINQHFKYFDGIKALGLVGSGNNGGDTLIALTHLALTGWTVIAYLVKDRSMEDPLCAKLIKAGGKIIRQKDDEDRSQLDHYLHNAAICIDGILGTGFKPPLEQTTSDILQYISNKKLLPYILAVDCPSGCECDNGEVAEGTIRADTTLCMAAMKQGLLKFPANNMVGHLEGIPIGLPPGIPVWEKIHRQVITKEFVQERMPVRKRDSHKGTFGTCLIVAGSINYTGAAYLAAKAAYRIGTGLVRMGVVGQIHQALAGRIPEATWLLLPDEMGVIDEGGAEIIIKNLDRVTALLIGPGVGTEAATVKFFRRLVEEKSSRKTRSSIGFVGEKDQPEGRRKEELPPMVVDADGLRILSKIPGWHQLLPPQSVLTPHPGEMSVLTGLPIEEIQQHREEIAAKFASEWGHIVVLKGALTVIASPDGKIFINPVATSALAKAGTGDVLAGAIAGLCAQGISSLHSAIIGVWLHAQAGLGAIDKVGHEASVMAADVAEALPDAISRMM
ncbi:MAG TPA: NAD(P)H-hydrate dehydratase [Anaerolineaceae bacterium]